MSAWLELADAMAIRLQSLTLVGDNPVIVDRQKSIETEVAKAVAKASGAMIQILWEGAAVDPDGDPIVTRPRYTIRLYTRPVLRDGDNTAAMADDLMESMASALHGWSPNEGTHIQQRVKITSDIDLVPDAKFLIYEFQVTGYIVAPDPNFKA